MAPTSIVVNSPLKEACTPAEGSGRPKLFPIFAVPRSQTKADSFSDGIKSVNLYSKLMSK